MLLSLGANAARRVGVLVRGRWLPESDLRARLEALAAKYRPQDEPPGAK